MSRVPPRTVWPRAPKGAFFCACRVWVTHAALALALMAAAPLSAGAMEGGGGLGMDLGLGSMLGDLTLELGVEIPTLSLEVKRRDTDRKVAEMVGRYSPRPSLAVSSAFAA